MADILLRNSNQVQFLQPLFAHRQFQQYTNAQASSLPATSSPSPPSPCQVHIRSILRRTSISATTAYLIPGRRPSGLTPNFGLYDNFVGFLATSDIRSNDVIRLLLVDEFISSNDCPTGELVMYDIFSGTQPGVQRFKKILRFRANRAKCSLQ